MDCSPSSGIRSGPDATSNQKGSGRRQHRLGGPVRITEEDWVRLEAAYRRPIPPNIRQDLTDLTTEHVASVHFELAAASVADARKELERLRNAIIQLRDLVHASGPLDAAHYARHLLINHVRDPGLGAIRLSSKGRLESNNPLKELTRILQVYLQACDSAAVELADPDYSVEVGESWDRWICRLTDRLASSRFPTGVRNDEEGISPFMSLIQQLQMVIPEEARQHHRSTLRALAQAIARARRSRDTKQAAKSSEMSRDTTK